MKFSFGLFLFVMLFAFTAAAQTPEPQPDVVLKRTAGVYPIKCHTPPDTDLFELCFVRSDVVGEPTDLGCTLSPDPNTTYGMDVTIARTPHDDAEIKCYVWDTSKNKGELSVNSGTVDFTPPGKPRIVVSVPSGVVVARQRMPDQLKQLVLWVE